MAARKARNEHPKATAPQVALLQHNGRHEISHHVRAAQAVLLTTPRDFTQSDISKVCNFNMRCTRLRGSYPGISPISR
jgi:peroxiredoxin